MLTNRKSVDQAKLKVEESHLQHAKDGETYVVCLIISHINTSYIEQHTGTKKELSATEKSSKRLSSEITKKLQEWKGAGVACSLALEEYKRVVSESTSLEKHSNLGVQCCEAAGREVLYSKEYLRGSGLRISYSR